MTRQTGEENLTDREVEILDATDEWHFAEPGHEALNYSLVEWVAHRLDISVSEASKELYGPHAPEDGAVV